MKFRIVYNAWWMTWAKGMVLWPWVWLKEKEFEKDMWTEETQNLLKQRLYRHELEHCYQIKRMGRLKFYSSYIWLFLKNGYRKHPYEVEANERENDPLTEQEKQWYENGKIIL